MTTEPRIEASDAPPDTKHAEITTMTWAGTTVAGPPHLMAIAFPGDYAQASYDLAAPQLKPGLTFIHAPSFLHEPPLEDNPSANGAANLRYQHTGARTRPLPRMGRGRSANQQF